MEIGKNAGRASPGAAIAGFQPTGDGRLHIGNLFASALPFAQLRTERRKFALIADAHALSLGRVPEGFSEARRRMARELMALGAAESGGVLFEQTAAPEIFALHALLSSFAPLGDLRRMTQFEEKAKAAEGEPLALLAYPCLMAADMFSVGADLALVGEDQRQHLELAKAIARRARERAGIRLSEPAALELEPIRIKSLADPSAKMSKSAGGAGALFLDEPAESLARKIRRAVTDSERLPEDPEEFREDSRPGAANLARICALAEGVSPREILADLAGMGHGALKERTAQSLERRIGPIRERIRGISDEQVERELRRGGEIAREAAARTYAEALRAVGEFRR